MEDLTFDVFLSRGCANPRWLRFLLGDVTEGKQPLLAEVTAG
jgi:hypothetical protein